MTYTPVSQTMSGWKISTNPDADADRRWRAEHPVFGTRYFDKREKVLEYSVTLIARKFQEMMKDPDARARMEAQIKRTKKD